MLLTSDVMSNKWNILSAFFFSSVPHRKCLKQIHELEKKKKCPAGLGGSIFALALLNSLHKTFGKKESSTFAIFESMRKPYRSKMQW